MVALGLPNDDAVGITVAHTSEDDGGVRNQDKTPPERAFFDNQDEDGATPDVLLSTTTATSSVIASLSSAEEGDSEDADDEASDDDPMFARHSLSTSEKDGAQGQVGDVEIVHEERNSTDVDSDQGETPAALPSPKEDRPESTSSRFSLASIPRRVRASVFSRKPPKPRVVKQIEAERPSSSDEKTTVSIDRESTLDTPSPGSAYASITLPSLTSFASITRSLSQKSEDKLSTGEFKSFWDEKLRNTMEKIAHRSRSDGGAVAFERQRSKLDMFHLLLKLYAHQDVIEELYASYESNELEFEFYIPQLCTFLVHGNYSKQHQLECFLMSRSGESLMFAHRLLWFIRSFCGDARGYQSEYLSVTSSPEEENADLLTAIQHRGGVPAVLMEQGLNIEEVSQPGRNLLLRRASSFSIDVAAEETNVAKTAEDDEAFAAFLKAKRVALLYEAMPEEGNEQQIALYNETPNFVTTLTDLADRLIQVSYAQRNDELRRGLAEISERSLPSNVIYLPIGNSCHRVKGFRLEECFTFSTKERVPYFLCVEVLDYSVSGNDDESARKKPKASLSRRRSRSRKFGIKLPFKKVKDPEPLRERMLPTDAKGFGFERLIIPVSNDLASVQELLDGLCYDESSRVPDDLYVEEETKTNEEPQSGRIIYDLFDKDVLAATPELPLRDSDVRARMELDTADNGEEGDDERDVSSNAEQKKKLGQWGLTRSRQSRPKKSSTSAESHKSASKFDSFYASWFAKKQKPQLSTLAEDSPAAESGADDVILTPQLDGVETVSQVEEEPAASANEPLPEPKSDIKATGPEDSSDDGQPKRRSRDISLSLDFTDADAWKRNFELEDVLTDAEPEVTGGEVETPEQTPEAEGEKLSDGEDDEDGDYEDEKPVIVFRERWSEKEDRIREESPLGSHPGWRLLSVIVKSNDDLRQEQFAAQLIAQCDRIFKDYSLPLRLRPYNVIATSAKAGLIEAVPNTVSLDSLKRNDPDYTTLLDFFQRLFGSDTKEFRRARRSFVESLAAYSILCYVFQIKDRHNGNILLDTEGHVVHIDFGFLLTNSPGSNLNFERAPFKLTDEFVELMGGARSATFRYFRSLCIRAYLALRRNMDKIVLLVEMMLVGNQDLPCFAGGKRAVIEGLKERLKPGARTSECQLFVNQLIDRSINNWRTRWYDKYQRAWVGIL